MRPRIDIAEVPAVPTGVGDAVGVSERKWFVAIVGTNTEKATAGKLEQLGYESYVAKQNVMRVWKNGRRAKVDKVVIPSVVFVRCTEKERRTIVTFPFISRFMTNRAGVSATGLNKPLAIVPQEQIDLLRFMLGQSDIPVTFTDAPFQCHDRVVVVRGGLKGIEGEVIHADEGTSEVIVRIDALGAACMTIDTVNLCLAGRE